MARPANLTSGKAVADIAEIYFLKHENGKEPVILNELESSNWFPVLTLKDSVEVDQADPTLNKINVDQFDAAIGTTVDPGDFNFSAYLPSLKEDALTKWFGNGVVQTNKSINGRKLVGLNLESKLYDVSVLIVTDTNDSILLTHVQVSLSFTKQDKVFMFKINGQVLAAANPDNEMFYIAHDLDESSSN